jgi:DNA polymerase elongation subunit (family B)
MKREVIAEKGIWTKKKRYVLSIWDKEGIRYDKPKLKYTGLEMKRSDTPKTCRVAMMKCCEYIMHGTQEELYEYVGKYYQEFMALPIEDIAKPKGVKEFKEKYIDPRSVTAHGCPQHVRAALWHNHLIKEKGLESVYPPILEGDKIKLAYLKMPNPTDQNAIGFVGNLPPEFGLDKYVDREALYEKNFLEPMARIADAAEWKLVKKANIADLFS